jgi:hypothetical protein
LHLLVNYLARLPEVVPQIHQPGHGGYLQEPERSASQATDAKSSGGRSPFFGLIPGHAHPQCPASFAVLAQTLLARKLFLYL